MTVDTESRVALALRALQKFDEVGETSSAERVLLMEACTHLGADLGLDCTGTDDGGGHYSHNGDTCPIHEWLVEGDSVEGRT